MVMSEQVLEREQTGPMPMPMPTMEACCEALTRAVFEAGMSPKVIESKWPGFERAFAGFDPDTIASFREPDVEALVADSRIVRNRQKIEAAIANATVLAAISRSPGGFEAWWRRHETPEALVESLCEHFRRVGESTGGRFLQLVGPVAPLDDRP